MKKSLNIKLKLFFFHVNNLFFLLPKMALLIKHSLFSLTKHISCNVLVCKCKIEFSNSNPKNSSTLLRWFTNFKICYVFVELNVYIEKENFGKRKLNYTACKLIFFNIKCSSKWSQIKLFMFVLFCKQSLKIFEIIIEIKEAKKTIIGGGKNCFFLLNVLPLLFNYRFSFCFMIVEA